MTGFSRLIKDRLFKWREDFQRDYWEKTIGLSLTYLGYDYGNGWYWENKKYVEESSVEDEYGGITIIEEGHWEDVSSERIEEMAKKVIQNLIILYENEWMTTFYLPIELWTIKPFLIIVNNHPQMMPFKIGFSEDQLEWTDEKYCFRTLWKNSEDFNIIIQAIGEIKNHSSSPNWRK